MKLILATNNPNKLREFREILEGTGVEILSQSQAGLTLDVEETGTTFAENSRLKAEAACRASGLPAIADDSGICCDALGGEPGVYSARYGGPGLDDSMRNALLVKNMRGKPDRTARFVCAVTCVFPNGDVLATQAECVGQLLEEERGAGGFGYDPLFYLPEKKKTTAELSPEEKNAVSHRGAAVRAMRARLEEYFRSGECRYADQ